MSKFYESFMNQYKTEKTASAQTAANGLGRFSTEELEKLANEIAEAFEDKEESKVKEEEKEENKDKEAECSEEDKAKEDKEAECSEEDKAKEDKEAECSEEDKEEDKEAGDEEEDKEAEDKEAEDEEAEDEDEEDSEEDKEAAFSDEDLEKMAFEFSEEKLAENGLGVIDYVYEKIANEEMSYFITENAEKLAYLTDQPVLKVANDIVNSILEKLS